MPTTVILRLGEGFRTEAEAGEHRFVLDEPATAGGTDEGPTPYDALAAALGGCIAMTLRFYAKREKIPLEGVDVAVTHDREHAKDCAECLSKEGFIHRFKVQIALKGTLSDEQKTKLLDIAKRCPVSKVLQSEIRIDATLAESVGPAE